MTQIVYADNNATTCVAPEVLEAMLPFFKETYFNPSSMYPSAAQASEAIAKARESIAAFLSPISF